MQPFFIAILHYNIGMMTTEFDYDRYDHVRPIRWNGTVLELLDQRQLPFVQDYVHCTTSDQVAEAIHALVVRGAPAIGIAAAWGVVLAANSVQAENGEQALQQLLPAMQRLHDARPTAVNLMWALQQMQAILQSSGADWHAKLIAMAEKITTDDLTANRMMGILGASLIEPGSGVLTHCNTGSLATAGFGTALGVIRAGVAQGRVDRVFAGETRPWMQGSRLTVWELLQDGIDATLVADSAASYLLSTDQVDWVIVGADRICANGDTANKIGTYQLAIAARYHNKKFMVVAPSSTVDMKTAEGRLIDIEQRDPAELLSVAGMRTVAEGITAWNPVFDVTPAELIDAIVTERGVILKPDSTQMSNLFE